jgi:GTP diphosphokinase / guanosine-3',5'-bis(diphosphate) 3'-diphosphatase
MSTENRETFFKRLYPFFTPSELLKIELAYILAKNGHRHQVRKETDEHGDPVRYFEHVRRATLIGVDEAKIVRLDTVIATILHDGPEDTRDLRPEMIELCFGSDICSIIKPLTKDPKEGYSERLLMCRDWRVLFAKGCDRLDNLRSLAEASVDFRRKQVGETRNTYYRIFDRMAILTPEEYRNGVRWLGEEIHRVTENVNIDC